MNTFVLSTTGTVVDVSAEEPTQTSAKKNAFSLAHFVRRTWAQLLIDLAIFCVGLAVALYLFFTLGRWETDNIKSIYARRAESIAGNLQSEIHDFEFELVSLGTQLQLQPNTTRAQFKVAFDRLNTAVTGKCSGCWQALSYAPFVPDAERTKYEAAAQADLNDTALVFRNTSRTPNPVEPEYVPVYYIEPIEGNKVWLKHLLLCLKIFG